MSVCLCREKWPETIHRQLRSKEWERKSFIMAFNRVNEIGFHFRATSLTLTGWLLLLWSYFFLSIWIFFLFCCCPLYNCFPTLHNSTRTLKYVPFFFFALHKANSTRSLYTHISTWRCTILQCCWFFFFALRCILLPSWSLSCLLYARSRIYIV